MTPIERRHKAYLDASLRFEKARIRAETSYYAAIGKADADYKRRTK